MAQQQTRQQIEAEIVDRIVSNPSLPEATISGDSITKTRGANHRRIHRLNRDSSLNKQDDLPGLVDASQNVSVSVNVGGFDQNGTYTPPVISLDVRDWRGAWAAGVQYTHGDKVTHDGSAYMRITATSEAPRAAGITNANEPDADATRWQLLFNLGSGGGGTPQPTYNEPEILSFSLSGIDLSDGNPAGGVDIRATLRYPDNIRGNTGGITTANNNLGIEWSVDDGTTYTSITGDVSQNITKDAVQQGMRITLPTINPLIAVNGELLIRLFAYDNQATPEKIVSNTLTFRRAQQHEYGYGFGASSRDDLVYANYDITAWDSRWDMSNEAYDVEFVLAGVPSNHYAIVFVPEDREPTEIRDVLGTVLTVGTDIIRVRNARTVGTQDYTVYYVHHTDSLPGDYTWRFIRR